MNIVQDKKNTKIAVAMSGGVDSSVTAALMVERYGKDNVFGVTMRLFCYGDTASSEKACCSIDAINDAKAVCESLGIAHYALNMEKEFEDVVIKNFISEYKSGHTPIPCVLCNSVIKFKTLLAKVESLGADMLATGHYARINKISNSKFQILNKSQRPNFKLLKGLDKTKDQSYFLYGLTQKQLAKTLFPLGGLKKTEVRKLAAKYKLKTAEKRESQGICFITEGRVTDWLRDKIKIKPGKIVDTKNNVVGEHEGVIFYTVGQRKRIGGGHAEPMYVVKVDSEKNEVIIGTKEDLYGNELIYISSNWVSGTEPKMPLKCSAKIRYNMEDEKCTISGNTKYQIPNIKQNLNSKLLNSGLNQNSKIKTKNYSVFFQKPQRAITPGQSVVFYLDDEVLGGGIIAE